MNKISTLALAAALLSSGAAFAQGLTRADVIADLQAARNSGELAAMTAEKGTEGLGNKAAAAKSIAVTATKPVPVTGAAKVAAVTPAAVAAPVAAGKTRAEVVAELAAAQADGSLVAQRVNAELGFTPAGKVVSATMLAGQPVKTAQ